MSHNCVGDELLTQPSGVRFAKSSISKLYRAGLPWGETRSGTPAAADGTEWAGGWDGWFVHDPAPRFLISGEGRVHLANPASNRALDEGQLAATALGVLKFGSGDCDARYLAAVEQVVGTGSSTRAVLRQRHGGWFTADVHGVPGETWLILALSAELAPTPRSMDAICEAFQLSRSETDVLARLLDGQCPKIAAKLLHISEHTVRAHLRSIYAKMGVRGLNNTIRLASSLL